MKSIPLATGPSVLAVVIASAALAVAMPARGQTCRDVAQRGDIADVLPAPPAGLAESRLFERADSAVVDVIYANDGSLRAVTLHELSEAIMEMRASRRNLGRGTTTLRLLVDSRGRVADVKVASSSGSPALDHGLMNVVQRAVFDPARLNMIAVSTYVDLPFAMR